MGISLIYSIVIILANTVGAISGMGGGVIIKPVFDAIGYHPVAAVSFYSSVAVFTMAMTSTIKQISNGIKIEMKPLVAISFGSVVGGVLGNKLFEYLLHLFPYEEGVKFIQIILTILSLLFVLAYTREGMKSYLLKKLPWYFVAGLFLGWLASLLGIGGGPINVTLLMLMFSIPIKQATTYSIITIFFSQLARLISVGMTPGFSVFDLSVLYWIIPSAILGGLLGGTLSNVFSDKVIIKIFKIVVVSVILLNVWNGVAIL